MNECFQCDPIPHYYGLWNFMFTKSLMLKNKEIVHLWGSKLVFLILCQVFNEIIDINEAIAVDYLFLSVASSSVQQQWRCLPL